MSSPSESLDAPQPRRGWSKPRLMRKSGGLSALTHGVLVGRVVPGFRNALYGFGLLLLVGSIALVFRRPDYASYFVVISLAAAVPMICWFGGHHKGLPVLPVFVLQQAVVYLMPLFMENVSLEGYPSGVVARSAWSIALFLLLLPVGWYFGEQALRAGPSRWNLALAGRDGGRAKALAIALALLSIGFFFELLSFTGWISSLLPGGLSGLFPLLRQFAAASSTLGALLGGYAVSVRGGTAQSAYYWLLLTGIAILSISGVLISAVTALVVAATIGQALGGRRVPWVFLGVSLGIVGFLNIGKFTMRERYWETMGGSKMEVVEGQGLNKLSLLQLPGFYAEWAAASVEKILIGQAAAEGADASGEEGQSLLDRINNYQNMVFVVNAQQTLCIRPLWGETYALIPPLFIPRMLWKEKPRTHEGQIRLNLHYGRQGSIEQTETTYIAWGLLPEAVGNFGVWFGPVILGPVLGFLFGLLEVWSRRKRFFSIEGFIALGLVLQVLVSFEMAASVFLTSAFQMVVALAVGGAILRMWLGSDDDPARRARLGRR